MWAADSQPARELKKLLPLSGDASVLFLWPVASEIREQGEPKTKLFAHSNSRASAGGIPWMLTLGIGKRPADADLQFADRPEVSELISSEWGYDLNRTV